MEKYPELAKVPDAVGVDELADAKNALEASNVDLRTAQLETTVETSRLDADMEEKLHLDTDRLQRSIDAVPNPGEAFPQSLVDEAMDGYSIATERVATLQSVTWAEYDGNVGELLDDKYSKLQDATGTEAQALQSTIDRIESRRSVVYADNFPDIRDNLLTEARNDLSTRSERLDQVI